MMVRRLEDGRLLIPVRAESEGGAAVGDSRQAIGEDHPDYKAWDEWLRRQEEGKGGGRE